MPTTMLISLAALGLAALVSMTRVAVLTRRLRGLRGARNQLAGIVEQADDAVYSLTAGGEISSWNAGADRLYGYGKAQALGMALTGLIAADREAPELMRLARVIAGGAVERYDTVHVRSDGASIDVAVTLSPIRDAHGVVLAASVIARDITEHKRFEGQLRYLADHDVLTGLFNRRRFEEDVERELARSRREGSAGALLAVDLDNFKEVNDSYGHSVGDELIRRTAGLLRDRLRTTDVLARLGGDEFAALLPATDADSARMVAAGLLRALRSESAVGTLPRVGAVTASIGIVSFDGEDEVTAAELLAEADIAMYDAKEAGRDRSASSRGQPGERPRVRTTWPQRIRGAIEQDRLVLLAQPIVALAGPPEPRHELLVRMLADDGEMIPPGVFLHAAERYDLIQEIDAWVLREAIRRLSREQRAGNRVRFSVNLSAKTVSDPAFAARLAAELEAAGADGAGLCIEVRETAASLRVAGAGPLAATLRELGCELAVDDFGAGLASFYSLKHLAFDYVKIDGEFIEELAGSEINQLVVRSIADIARGLGKRTIAECVGDRATVELLSGFGVDYAQGFFLGQPQPLDAIELWPAETVPERGALPQRPC
jgi:diguanylate cyclase (GGDEF)-like protein/PAS domain S-box-containing protein